MREGSIENQTISGGIFTPTVKKFNNLKSSLEFDKDGGIAINFDNAKKFFGKNGCGDILASSCKTRRNSDFAVANRKIRAGWKKCKFESIDEKEVNEDVKAYSSLIEFYIESIKNLTDILKKRFNRGYEYLKEIFERKITHYYGCMSASDEPLMAIASYYFGYAGFTGFVGLCFGALEATTAAATCGLSILALGVALLAVTLIIKLIIEPIINRRDAHANLFGKEGLKIFKLLSDKIEKNKKELEKTLNEIKKFTVKFKKIDKNGDEFLKTAKEEAEKYLRNKRIGRHADLDKCKIQYFEIIKKFYVPKNEEELKDKENDVKAAESVLNKLPETS